MMAMRSAARAGAVPSNSAPASAATVVLSVSFISSSQEMAPPFASACMKRSGSGDPLDAGGDLVRLEDALPVVAHEHRLAELDRLVAGVGERAFTLAEDHGSQHVDVTEQE